MRLEARFKQGNAVSAWRPIVKIDGRFAIAAAWGRRVNHQPAELTFAEAAHVRAQFSLNWEVREIPA
jgi:hypothetical protein